MSHAFYLKENHGSCLAYAMASQLDGSMVDRFAYDQPEKINPAKEQEKALGPSSCPCPQVCEVGLGHYEWLAVIDI